MRGIDHEAVALIIRETSASEIMPRFLKLEEDERWKKLSGSVVTAADLASEQLLAERLPPLLPGSVVVGEEMVEKDPLRLGLLDGSEPVWVLDPVDGTRNFANGVPDFAVMVALVVKRQPLAAWIYRPIDNIMYMAEAGAGAYRDGTRLEVAPASRDLTTLSGSLGGWLRRNTDLSLRFDHVTATRCVGVDYCALADGRIHFAHFRGVHAWDHAPGVLMHREAGGHCRSLDGTLYRVGAPGRGGILLAPDRPTWKRLQPLVREALSPVL